jgi:putative peptidoglycan lipid II flippase
MTMSTRRIGGAAALIAILTVASRLAGFVRTIVFASSVGATDLGSVYQTANTIPNIIFELVAGGALASLVVPLLAGPIAAGDRDRAGATASALLTWTVAVLALVGLVVAVAAGPIVDLLANRPPPDVLATGTHLLRIFSIQLPLYGVGIVLAGVLQAHHRFAWPVLAPLLSSLTVIGAYLTFAIVDAPGVSVAQASAAGVNILGIGTTLGVAVLTLCLVWPVRRLALPWRATLWLEGDERRRAVGLAGAAVITVAAQQLSLALMIFLANGGGNGALVVYTLAQTVFLLPWAVLAVPVATSAFPVLSAAHASRQRRTFDATLARSGRAVILLSCFGAAALVGLALPAGLLLSRVTAGHPDAGVLAAAIAGFAPGLLGYAVFALLTRALYAAGQTRWAALATAVGWAATSVAAIWLATAFARAHRVVALAAANSVGMTVLGAALVVVVARRLGRNTLHGGARALATGVASGVLGAALATAVSWGVMRVTPGVAGALAAGMLATVALVAGFGALAYATDRGDLRPLLARLAARLRRAPTRATSEDGEGT